MRLLRLLAILPLLAAAPRAPDKDKPEPKKAAKVETKDLNDLHLEVMALQVLHNLRPTPAQLKSLAALAEKTAAEDPPRKAVKVSADYLKALKGLRAALVADDDEAVDGALEALDKLREDEPEFDVVEITDAARKHAPAVFRALSARQVAFYVGGFGDDFPDPGELLHQALKEARSLKGVEWEEHRDDVADQVGWLVAGLDGKAEAKARAQAKDLLDEAHRLDDKAFAAAEAKLKKQAADLAAKAGPADVIRHFLERTLAELLSNPQLKTALEARKKDKETRRRGDKE